MRKFTTTERATHGISAGENPVNGMPCNGNSCNRKPQHAISAAKISTWGALLLAGLVGCGRPNESFPPQAAAQTAPVPSVGRLSKGAGSALESGAVLAGPPTSAATPQTQAPNAPQAAPVQVAARPPEQVAQAPTAAPSVPSAGGNIGGKEPPLFQGWAKPEATLVLSGEMDGYVEPCGCAGKDNMKGGIARRFTFLEQLRTKGWNVVPLDVGGHIKRFGPQNEIKFAHIVDALKQMKYKGVALGKRDLALSAGDLLNVVSDADGPFVSANVSLFDADSDFIPKYRIVEINGRKIGITAVIGDGYRQEIKNDEIHIAPAADALAKIVPEMQQKADFLVLLSQASPAETAALAQKFPQFQLAVTAGGADEPPLQPLPIANSKTGLIECGHKGMYLVVIGIYGPGVPWRYQRVPVDARYNDAESMRDVMRTYQRRLEQAGLKGLGLNPVAHASGRAFVGSQACADCHTSATKAYHLTTHSTAWKTLAELDVPRHHDPECLSCHVVGWEPQKFYPFKTGYLSADLTPLLKDNGCENCHGPGGSHVAAEEGTEKVSDAEKLLRRTQMHSDLATAEQSCRTCHDVDNSPAFNFADYWESIKHTGKD